MKFHTKKVEFDRWVPLLVVLVALSGVIFIVSDWSKIRFAMAQADWRPIPIALLATMLSYICISLSFAKVSKLLGVIMRTKELSVVGFISAALNHIVLSGGAAGYSVRFMLMHRYGVTMREVVAISILHFYLTALWMVMMLPVSLIYLALNAPLNQATAKVLVLTGAFLLIGTILTTILIFSSKSRKKIIAFLVRLVRSLTRRDISGPLEGFDATMGQGIQAMRKRPSTIVIISCLVVLDWSFSVTALWFCFRALDLEPHIGQLISGFVIGTMAGVASALPGGLGVQEASMTGVLTLFGIPVERGALVAILYRVIYTIIPYLTSLGFYRVVLNRERTRKRLSSKESDYENTTL